MALGQLLSGFITILVGVTLLPTIANEVQGVLTNDTPGGVNVTGAAATITSLTTLFFALGIVSAGIAIAVGGLQESGLM